MDHDTYSLTSRHSKVNIKSINKDECLIHGITKEKMSTLVTGISHTFIFVPEPQFDLQENFDLSCISFVAHCTSLLSV